ncbi:MAG: hypothetical protein IKT46_03775 [Clostridia bacterium]|nr:hypothetical protein [Clostridia bacterium]
MNKKQVLKRTIIWLCVFLTLCYPFIALLSYYHSCNDEECPVCGFVEITKRMLTAALAATLCLSLAGLIYDRISIIPQRIFYKNGTLVLQKIKLSA